MDNVWETLTIKVMTIPIEETPELLQEYGRAFALINLIDYSFGTLIMVQGDLLKADHNLVENMLDSMFFSKKIDLAKDYIGPELYNKCLLLNKKRTVLAHGVTGLDSEIGLYIHKSKNTQKFTFELLKEISELAREVFEEMGLLCLHLRNLSELDRVASPFFR